VAHATISPVFFSGETPNDSKDSVRRIERFRDIILCLALLGPTAVVRLDGWFQYNDEALNDLSQAGSFSSFSIDGALQPSYLRAPPNEVEVVTAKSLVRAYFKLRGHSLDKVRRSLDRLNQAMRRLSPGDAAIDLSIALEALITDGGHGEHTWKVGLRSALLSGGDLKTREETRRIIKEIYNLRSPVMHEGYIKKAKEAEAPELIKQGIARCASVISQVIRRGHVPKDNEWSEFELSGGKRPIAVAPQPPIVPRPGPARLPAVGAHRPELAVALLARISCPS